MNSIRIDILNPKAIKLLEDLEVLDLISIKRDSSNELLKTLAKLRKKAEAAPSLDEITEEVEKVRSRRYKLRDQNK